MSTRSPMPIVTLSTGLRVGNLGSPHAFTFTDGSVLPAAESDRVQETMLTAHEQEFLQTVFGPADEAITWVNIDLEFLLNARTADCLLDAFQDWKRGKVDIVIVPLPCLLALKKAITDFQPGEGRWNPFPFDTAKPSEHPFRTCRLADRTTKTVHTDRFCL